MQYCTTCLTPSTRPRVAFAEDGRCNACVHAERKRTTIDWSARWRELEELCDRFRGTGQWDVLVPCSGGKDGSYVAWRLKHDLGMNPLCVTLMPQTQTELGARNLRSFQEAGFDHVAITPNRNVYRRLAIKGFVEQGRPKMPFVTGISTVTLNVAAKFGVPFIVYGEEGEEEYGGESSQEGQRKIDREYLVRCYYSGYDPKEYLSNFSESELAWWTLPPQGALDALYPAHWSRFEDWDPKVHEALAREKCGLVGMEAVQADGESLGTFTGGCQLDDDLQDLHAYMMYVKFGFGRATSDVNIEIRARRMMRDEGLEIVQRCDGLFPMHLLKTFLVYFRMSEAEFWSVVDSFVGTDVLTECDVERWVLKPNVWALRQRGGSE